MKTCTEGGADVMVLICLSILDEVRQEKHTFIHCGLKMLNYL